jgi:hypothetical protein
MPSPLAFPFSQPANGNLGLLLASVPAVMSFALHSGYCNVIEVISPRERSSFWKRKRDDVFMLVVSALVGAAVGAAVTWLVGR